MAIVPGNNNVPAVQIPPQPTTPWWIAVLLGVVVLGIVGIAGFVTSAELSDHTIEAGLTAIVSGTADPATKTFAESELHAVSATNAAVTNGLLSFIASILTAFFGIFGVGYAARTGFVNMAGQNQMLQSQWSTVVAQNTQLNGQLQAANTTVDQFNTQLSQVRGLLDSLDPAAPDGREKVAQARGILAPTPGSKPK